MLSTSKQTACVGAIIKLCFTTSLQARDAQLDSHLSCLPNGQHLLGRLAHDACAALLALFARTHSQRGAPSGHFATGLPGARSTGVPVAQALQYVEPRKARPCRHLHVPQGLRPVLCEPLAGGPLCRRLRSAGAAGRGKQGAAMALAHLRVQHKRGPTTTMGWHSGRVTPAAASPNRRTRHPKPQHTPAPTSTRSRKRPGRAGCKAEHRGVVFFLSSQNAKQQLGTACVQASFGSLGEARLTFSTGPFFATAQLVYLGALSFLFFALHFFSPSWVTLLDTMPAQQWFSVALLAACACLRGERKPVRCYAEHGSCL